MTTPRIRAGDSDRQKSVDRLARHFTEGRLDSGEYDQRVRRAYASVYLDELPALFTDLPAEPMPVDTYDKAWRQSYGPVGQGVSGGSGGTPLLMQRLPRIVAFVSLAVLMLWFVLVTRGFFFPVPLVWIGLFGLNAARRGHHRPGPGPRR